MNKPSTIGDELRDKLTVMYFNALVQGLSLEEVAKIPKLALGNGEKLIDEVMELFEQQTKQALTDLRKDFEKNTWGHYDPFAIIDEHIAAQERRKAA